MELCAKDVTPMSGGSGGIEWSAEPLFSKQRLLAHVLRTVRPQGQPRFADRAYSPACDRSAKILNLMDSTPGLALARIRLVQRLIQRGVGSLTSTERLFLS